MYTCTCTCTCSMHVCVRTHVHSTYVHCTRATTHAMHPGHRGVSHLGRTRKKTVNLLLPVSRSSNSLYNSRTVYIVHSTCTCVCMYTVCTIRVQVPVCVLVRCTRTQWCYSYQGTRRSTTVYLYTVQGYKVVLRCTQDDVRVHSTMYDVHRTCTMTTITE